MQENRHANLNWLRQEPNCSYYSGTSTAAAATVYAYISDGAGSGLDYSSASVYPDSMPVSSCTLVHGAGVHLIDEIQCPVSALAEGAHNFTMYISDMARNRGSASSSFVVDTVAPNVSGTTQAGTINTASATVYAYLSDASSGTHPASVTVQRDAAALAG